MSRKNLWSLSILLLVSFIRKFPASVRRLIYLVYPRGFELRSGAKPVSEEEVKVKKQELKKISSEVVKDEGEFRTIKEAKTKDKAIKLKKMKRCGYDINELDKKYKGTKDKFDDLDFNYEDLKMSGTKAVWKRP